MNDKELDEELIDLGASGYNDGVTGPSTNEKDRADVDLEDIPIIHVGGAACYTNQVALEVEGRFKIIHTDGTEEIIEGKTPLCSCGQSKSKPYCDQTHQQF